MAFERRARKRIEVRVIVEVRVHEREFAAKGGICYKTVTSRPSDTYGQDEKSGMPSIHPLGTSELMIKLKVRIQGGK